MYVGYTGSTGCVLLHAQAAAGGLIASLVLLLVVSLRQGSTAPGVQAAAGQKGPDSEEKIPAVRGKPSRRGGKES